MDVCLVSMPYAAIERPSIALGLLTAALRGAGIETEGVYASLAFAERIGLQPYGAVLDSRTNLLIGEWTFAAAAFPEKRAIELAYLRMCDGELPANLLVTLRARATRFVSELADDIVRRRPRIVGCTSTFQQQTASIALLRAIKERDPSIVTMIGGTNNESAMGLAVRRACPWIDYVVSGEADELIVPFVRSVLWRTGNPACPEERKDRQDCLSSTLPLGVIDAETAHRRDIDPPRASVWNVDAIPTPDYDDYFAALERSPLKDAVVPALVVETSRGCWWGAKSHCTFCGLNGGNMAYRAKSADRAVEEFHRLAARYGIRRFTVVDNILDMPYHETVLPRLAGHGYDIFYETKANLRRKHMQTFAEAGVRTIQPGIESFHEELLRLMAKGNKPWMNVQVLKWAAELGMDVSWVFLIDVPGQQDEWYFDMLKWLPLVTHLAPPAYPTPIQFLRFAPYHRDAAKYGFDLVPEPAYSFVYPVSAEEMQDLAYYFVERTSTRTAGLGQRLLVALIGIWRDHHRNGSHPILEMRRHFDTLTNADALTIIDTRSCRTADRHRLQGEEARVYLACDEAIERKALAERLGCEVDRAVQSLLEKQLLLDFGGRLLALAVDVTNRKPAEIPNPGGSIRPEVAVWLASADRYLEDCRTRATCVRASELAQRMKRTPLQLSREFHASVGSCVKDYLRRRQIDYAKELLRATARSTSQIAVEAGFGTARSFYRAFRQTTGLTPTEFRKEMSLALPDLRT